MAQHVTERDVRGIAEYTRIHLDEDEVKQMTVDLNDIIESLKPITEYDLDGVEPTFHPIGSLSNCISYGCLNTHALYTSNNGSMGTRCSGEDV